MTVTRVRSRWLLAWDGGEHVVVPNGELVLDGDRVVHAGSAWRGRSDQVVDAGEALVAPGFVNVHVHAGPLAAGRAYDDRADPQAQSLGFLQYVARPEGEGPDPMQDAAVAARATVAELLRGGTTCAVEIGGETGVPPEAMADAGAELGLRLVLGKGFRSRDYVRHDDGSVGYRNRPDLGAGAFAAAVAFAREIVRRDDPWLDAMLFPLQVDTCNADLLRAAYEVAEELGIALQVHGAQTPFEVDALERQQLGSPVEHLQAAGALGPRTILAHAVLLRHHSWRREKSSRDVELLAASGAGVAHCPVAMARRGLCLESFGSYLDAGIPLAIGTDTYPRDLVAEMRWATYLSRIVDRRSASPTAAEALAAATTVPADLIGRHDLGRLARGMRADFQIVDLDRLRTSPVVDPVGAWIHAGVAESVRAVWTGGIERVRNGVVLGMDGQAPARKRQRDAAARRGGVPPATSRRRSPRSVR